MIIGYKHSSDEYVVMMSEKELGQMYLMIEGSSVRAKKHFDTITEFCRAEGMNVEQLKKESDEK